MSNEAKNGGDLKAWRRSLPKRLSFRPGSNNMSHGNSAQNSADKECQTDGSTTTTTSPHQRSPTSGEQSPVKIFGISPRSCNDAETSPASGGADNESTFNLERSQSLRISKHSLRKISKGGSLRCGMMKYVGHTRIVGKSGLWVGRIVLKNVIYL